MATNHVEGKVIAVTGSGSGFGRLVCIKTAAKGAKVLAIDINEEGLKVTEEEVKKAGGTIITRKADVTDLAALKAAFADAVKEYGSLDVVVNNAGIMPLGELREI
jgi:NAD(P)-dependent dehydrogenase (short-subunit alcohol dehydrogenase family)